MAIRVGFIGLGNQGKPIASHLAPAGFETWVHDIDEAPMAELVATGDLVIDLDVPALSLIHLSEPTSPRLSS